MRRHGPHTAGSRLSQAVAMPGAGSPPSLAELVQALQAPTRPHDGPWTPTSTPCSTCLTLGGRAGIDLSTLQELAGHSTPTLTARYTHSRFHDQTGTAERLSGFLPEQETGLETLAARHRQELQVRVLPGGLSSAICGMVQRRVAGASGLCAKCCANRSPPPTGLFPPSPGFSTRPHLSPSDALEGLPVQELRQDFLLCSPRLPSHLLSCPIIRCPWLRETDGKHPLLSRPSRLRRTGPGGRCLGEPG
jgi:hypothetical protein